MRPRSRGLSTPEYTQCYTMVGHPWVYSSNHTSGDVCDGRVHQKAYNTLPELYKLTSGFARSH